MKADSFTIAFHGGAGDITRTFKAGAYKESLTKITKALYEFAKFEDKTALDVAEYGVRLFEDDELFNAGKGAVYAVDGTHEMDASIMCGTSKTCGAVSMFTRTKNPISAARTVMEKTTHIFMVGETAEEMVAQLSGVALVEGAYFDTEKRRHQLEDAKILSAAAGGPTTVFLDHDLDKGAVKAAAAAGAGGGGVTVQSSNTAMDSGGAASASDGSETVVTSSTASAAAAAAAEGDGAKGTVGCVCVKGGRVAAATSTGGMTNKLNGRVGDSPIIGSGTYANNATCAVSATGHGEEYIRHVVAYDISARMEYAKQSLHDAVQDTIYSRLPAGAGGVIAVDAAGNCEMVMNCSGMYRGTCDSAGNAAIGIWDEMETVTL